MATKKAAKPVDNTPAKPKDTFAPDLLAASKTVIHFSNQFKNLAKVGELLEDTGKIVQMRKENEDLLEKTQKALALIREEYEVDKKAFLHYRADAEAKLNDMQLEADAVIADAKEHAAKLRASAKKSVANVQTKGWDAAQARERETLAAVAKAHKELDEVHAEHRDAKGALASTQKELAKLQAKRDAIKADLNDFIK